MIMTGCCLRDTSSLALIDISLFSCRLGRSSQQYTASSAIEDYTTYTVRRQTVIVQVIVLHWLVTANPRAQSAVQV